MRLLYYNRTIRSVSIADVTNLPKPEIRLRSQAGHDDWEGIPLITSAQVRPGLQNQNMRRSGTSKGTKMADEQPYSVR